MLGKEREKPLLNAKPFPVPEHVYYIRFIIITITTIIIIAIITVIIMTTNSYTSTNGSISIRISIIDNNVYSFLVILGRVRMSMVCIQIFILY